MDKLLETLAVPWTRRWSGQVAAAALVFWAVGLYLRLVTGPERPARCPAEGDALWSLWCRTEQAGLAGRVTLGLLAVAAVVGSALLVAAATPRLLRLLGGAGLLRGGPFGWLARVVLRLSLRRALARRLAAVRAGIPGTPPAPVRLGRAGPLRSWRAEWRGSGEVLRLRSGALAVGELRCYPRDDALMAPTRIGCLLAALGERIRSRHGLDLPLCWEPLLAVLPADARRRLEDESRRVVLRAQTLLWTAAAVVWTPWFPGWLRVAWPVAVLLTARMLYSGLRECVQVYCDLIEASVALYRDRIYTGCGWRTPASTADERRLGEEFSAYLAGWSFTEDQPLRWPDPQPLPLPVAPVSPGAAP